MSVYCHINTCEANASHFIYRHDDTPPLPLCGQCLEAFELGQANAHATVRDLQPDAEGMFAEVTCPSCQSAMAYRPPIFTAPPFTYVCPHCGATIAYSPPTP